ncbi:MAG: RluA family pseudouridine synthase [Planctomycetes bacterium]|nr:RluA family pseudouridine synthase [Planctomycetota bacterium]
MDTHAITSADAGQRLDRWLRKALPAVPLAAIFRHVRSGRIRVDGKKADGALRLAEGMQIELRLAPADLAALTAERPRRAAGAAATMWPSDLAPKTIFADEDILVVDKPAGLAAQPGTGAEAINLVAWLDRQGLGQRSATFAPAPAHRLDRGTSGLLAIGLSARGLRGLTAAFRDDVVVKGYVAVVHGAPASTSGSITAPLREIVDSRPERPRVVVDAAGRPARTDWTVLGTFGDTALLRLSLFTGRLHQIRAHLAHLGHPIVGDRRYGSRVTMPGRFLLHAARLALPHPVTGAALDLRAPLPAHFGAAARTPIDWP